MLEYAISSGAPKSLVARAALILRQPGDSAPHDDHMHVRIFCPQNDLRVQSIRCAKNFCTAISRVRLVFTLPTPNSRFWICTGYSIDAKYAMSVCGAVPRSMMLVISAQESKRARVPWGTFKS